MKRLMLLLPLFFLLILPQYIYADTISGSGSAVVSPTPISVDYTLPYPGLLPDNPLYVLKVFRDKLISFFISDPLKRSSFDVLQADKRLEGAYYLQKKDSREDVLIGSTVSKAENYLDEAIGQVKQANGMGEDINPQLTTLRNAVLKHQEVVIQMMQGASPQLKQILGKELGRLGNFEKMVNALSKK